MQSLQKELKALDRELKNNGLIRISDSSQKSQNSLYRALAMSIYYSHSYHTDVISEIKLTMISNLSQRRANPYPIIHQSAVLKKYIAEPELLLNYWTSPDLTCFHNDALIIASAAFGRSICILHVDKDEYLHELYISASKNPNRNYIQLAKIGKKYYAVLRRDIQQALTFVKQRIIEEIFESIFEGVQKEKEERVHYPSYDQVITSRPRQHKKSLSDCGGELPAQSQPFDQGEKKFQEISDRGYTPPSTSIYQPFEEDFYSLKGNAYDVNANLHDPSISGYYGYNYSQYGLSQEANYNYLESPCPVNNARYTGRLKFFDQAGNYGFIVIDSLNIDLFVHYDDLSKAGISKQKLVALKNNYELRFQLTCHQYEGKQHRKSKKAVDLKLILQ